MKQTKRLTSDDFGVLLFIFAFLLGGVFRIFAVANLDFPLNDGGLFYKIIETLQENNFMLPLYIEYNGLQIPFVYPPLAFYLAAIISYLLHIPILEILIWMPAVTLVGVLPCIYYFIKIFFNSSLIAGMATFLYAFIPRTITWFIMGGGVTRSLGQLFLILAITQVYLLFTKKQNKYIFSSIIFSASVVVTHPEASIHTIGASFVIWIFYGKNWKAVRDAFLVGVGTLIASAPWWLSAIMRFGIAPLLAASQTTLHTPLAIFQVLFPVTEEPLIAIIAVLAVIGFFIQMGKREYFLPVWIIFHFLLEPRSAANIAIIPIAILAAICILDLILPRLANLNIPKDASINIFQSAIEKTFFVYITVSLIINMSYHIWQLQKNIVTPNIQESMLWVKENLPSDSRFLIITGIPPLNDYTNEWFPILASRQSITTIQGTEWIKSASFNEKLEALSQIQICSASNHALICIENLVQKNGYFFEYMIVKIDAKYIGNLIADLKDSSHYAKIFESDEILIMKKAD